MYHFYNVEPNKERLGDCVIRAITLALGIPYHYVVELLYQNGLDYECDEICMDCYGMMLDNFDLEHFRVRTQKTVKEVSQDFYDSIVLIRTNGHLTVSMFGTVVDIWDCTEEYVTDIWLVD